MHRGKIGLKVLLMKLKNFDIYKNKKVLVTGHTGFKGSWLTQWLLLLNAKVYGYALDPLTSPSLYQQLQNENKIESNINDIRNFKSVKKFIQEIQPDIIFHLAAQPLVRESYDNPMYTLETNTIGTANVLEAVRQLSLSTNIIIITSDKCYDNKEWIFGYRENDALGGFDPYSASKGAAEIVVSSWRNSFFNPDNFEIHGVKLASARAGNVIGGGDWSDDRIIPDCIRALQKNKTIQIRNPLATRPWQHVLESLGGYLLLGRKLLSDNTRDGIKNYSSAFNFGPYGSSNKPVEDLVNEVLNLWEGNWKYNKEDALHEAFLLNLNIDKATQLLNWTPVWNFETTIKNTVEWYKKSYEDPDRIIELTNKQIEDYSSSFFSNTIKY